LLRIGPLRDIFLSSALSSASAVLLQAKADSEAGEEYMQDVRLMLHSRNVLRDHGQYLVNACELWAELESLKNFAGWEYKANLTALNKKYMQNERGQKKLSGRLWAALRQSVFDKLAQDERELIETEDLDVAVDLDCDDISITTSVPSASRDDDDGNSVSTSMGSMDAILRDASMLQHVLLRVLSLHALPTFLASAQYGDLVQELATLERLPIHAALEVELECLRAAVPSSSEEWLGLLLSAITHLPHGVLVCDASLPSLPILGVNTGFEVLTGYKSAEVVGRNCQFLQGDATDAKAVQKLREALRAQESCHVTLLNYRKDGTTFLNLLSLSPIFDRDNLCRFFVGTVSEVYEHYSGMKPQLRHADRLHKLLPRRLLVSSSEEARVRMTRTRETVMRKHPVQSIADDDSVISHCTTTTTTSRAPTSRASVMRSRVGYGRARGSKMVPVQESSSWTADPSHASQHNCET